MEVNGSGKHYSLEQYYGRKMFLKIQASGVQTIETFYIIFTLLPTSVFIIASLFQPSLIFAGKAGAYTNGALEGLHSLTLLGFP